MEFSIEISFPFQKNLLGGSKMGLYKQYFRVTRHARDKILGNPNNNDYHPLQMLISEQGKLSHSKYSLFMIRI